MSRFHSTSDDGPERQWLGDDATTVEDPPTDPAASLVSLGFFTAALRRSKWFWRTTAVVGLLVGSALYLKAPQTHQASTTLLLTVGAESTPGQAILEDQALAESHSMAKDTLQKLGSHESVNSFLSSYTVTPLTDRVLQITATAPSSTEAVRLANALASGYLKFRADQLQAEQQLEFNALDQQLVQDKQHVRANNDLVELEQQVSASKASTKINTATMIGGSAVLDPASPITPHSRLKHLLLYAAGGFIIGLILGMGIIVLRALLSDRLRRRDDVAHALAAPVKLSVPAMRASGWLPGRRGRVSDRSMQRIVGCLRDAVPEGSSGTAALAVVPVDDPQVAAQSVVSLAEACAQQGRRVVVADLCSGAPAAKLLGAKGPGVHTASVDGARLVAAVPDPAEFAPVGPLRPASLRSQPVDGSELAAACASADLLLSLITLDPSVGGDHLATWTSEVVVVVTAGRSSWTKIHAVGEMIRLASSRLVCAVLVGADKTDESLGVTPASGVDRDAVTTQGVRAHGGNSLVGDRRGRPSAPDAVMAPGIQDNAEGYPGLGGRGRPSDDGAGSRLQTDPPEHAGHRRRTGR